MNASEVKGGDPQSPHNASVDAMLVLDQYYAPVYGSMFSRGNSHERQASGFCESAKEYRGRGLREEGCGSYPSSVKPQCFIEGEEGQSTTQSSERCAGERVSTVTVIKPGYLRVASI